MSFTGEKLQFTRQASGKEQEKPKYKFTDFNYHQYQPRTKQVNGKGKKQQPRPKPGPTPNITTWRKSDFNSTGSVPAVQHGPTHLPTPVAVQKPQRTGGFPLNDGRLQPVAPRQTAIETIKVEAQATTQLWPQVSAQFPTGKATNLNATNVTFTNESTHTAPTLQDAQSLGVLAQLPTTGLKPEGTGGLGGDAAFNFFRYLLAAKSNLVLQLQLLDQQAALLRPFLTPEQLEEAAAGAGLPGLLLPTPQVSLSMDTSTVGASFGLQSNMQGQLGALPLISFPQQLPFQTAPLQTQDMAFNFQPLQQAAQATPPQPVSMMERRDSIISTATTVVDHGHHQQDNSLYMHSPSSIATPGAPIDSPFESLSSLPWSPEFDPSSPADEILDTSDVMSLNNVGSGDLDLLPHWQ
eukprot:comp16954_c0_seq1/m.15561 comp16954_c0_seq1/g.15561  ORF comp16954_c0_seq1/g.15561 comp16954_c0_seq1/m.15561 type:complete len:408 (-) comp16954_c0_seq1:737-1960(-)